jgi:hypothetical protein
VYKEWHYNGDMNVKGGGFWWKESGYDDHVYCVEIIPCSSFGQDDNEFIIYNGSIFLSKDWQERAINSLQEDNQPATRANIVEQVMRDTGIDGSFTVRICVGKRKENSDIYKRDEINRYLRKNVNLRKWIEEEFLI